jgi:hypothetical protein
MAQLNKRPSTTEADGTPKPKKADVETAAGEQFSGADLKEALQDFVCYLCNRCTGETMIRTNCRNCILQVYFCKSHLSSVPNRCAMCKTVGVKHRADWGVTRLLESAYIECPSDGCNVKVVAKRIGHHLLTDCLHHVETCSLPGCEMR